MIDPDEFNAILGKELCKHREELGYGIIRFSNIVNISHSYINRIEKGRSKISLFELYKYCEGLNVSPHEIILAIDKQMKR